MNHDYHNSCKCKYTRSEAGDTCHNWYSTDTAYPELVVRWGELTALGVRTFCPRIFLATAILYDKLCILVSLMLVSAIFNQKSFENAGSTTSNCFNLR